MSHKCAEENVTVEWVFLTMMLGPVDRCVVDPPASEVCVPLASPSGGMHSSR